MRDRAVILAIGPGFPWDRQIRLRVAGRVADVLSGGAAEFGREDVAAAIVHDAPAAEVSLLARSRKPLLLGALALRRLLEADQLAEIAQTRWIPDLPLGVATDVRRARELVADGSTGPVRSVQVSVFYGRPHEQAWEPDGPIAASRDEALVFGLDLAQRLTGDEILGTISIGSIGEAIGIGVHQMAGGTTVLTEQLPLGHGADVFRATVTCERGVLMLRHEFAPSALVRRDPVSRKFVAYALGQDKVTRKAEVDPSRSFGALSHLQAQNILTPDSSPAGWETAALLASLLGATIPDVPQPASCIRLIRHVLSVGGALQQGQMEPIGLPR